VQPFYLSFSIPELQPELSHSKGLAFLGSCFSDEIAAKASYAGFHAVSNPVGTVFHPLALARFLSNCLMEKPIERLDSIDDRFISWDASSKFCSGSRWGLLTKLTETRKAFNEALGSSSHLFITFGTAWGYALNEDGIIVSNCHKAPAHCFTKSLTVSGEIVSVWLPLINELKRSFPELTLVFTVSPVRHIRDGMVQNNQSKAVLLDAVRQICEQTESVYFPSYEIVIDELRDYRFFKQDRLHPSEEAIDYVWSRLVESACTHETKALMGEIVRYRKLKSHIPMGDDQSKHELKMAEKLAAIHVKFPSFAQ
jgi:hypothetical protein